RVGGDHGHVMLVCNSGGRNGIRRAERRQQELRALLGYQLLRYLSGLLSLAGVVLVGDLDRMPDVLDEDPAIPVRPVSPQLVALLGKPSLLNESAGRRERRTDHDRIADLRSRLRVVADRAVASGANQDRRHDRYELLVQEMTLSPHGPAIVPIGLGNLNGLRAR